MGRLRIGPLCVWKLIVCLACSVPSSGRAPAQNPQSLHQRAEALRSQIASAEAQPANPERLGGLWLALANTYQSAFEPGPAEAAFGHALRLLQGARSQPQYADALHGMGAIYMQTGRVQSAIEFLQQSSDLYVALADKRHAASVRVTLAIALLTERRFAEAEGQSAQAVREFETEDSPNTVELTSAYVSRSLAECAQRRCLEARVDADRAIAIVKARLPLDSIELVSAWVARGSASWKSGDLEDADRALREALRVSRVPNGTPKVVSLEAEMRALQCYHAFLNATHRKLEAKQIEVDLARVQEQ